MRNMDGILLEEILSFLKEEELDALGERLRADQACYQYFLEKRRAAGMPVKNTEELVNRIASEMEQHTALARNFNAVLGEFIDRANMKDPEVYRAIGMHRNKWSRMKQDGHRRDKVFILKLCIILRLDLYEAYYLLSLAGYTFVPDDRRDYIVCRCLREKIYDPFEVDLLLDSQKEAPLFSEDSREETT